MPTAAPKPCSQCGVLVRDGTSRCESHKVRAGTFADRSRGTRKQRGYGPEWDKRRERVMRRDAGICQPCLRHGLVHNGHAVDHRIPREFGGTEDDSNLQVICKTVHQAKTDSEKHGRLWDEDAWFAAQAAAAGRAGPSARPSAGAPATQGGGQKSRGSAARTDRLGKFSRAGVVGGGYPREGGI